MIKGSKERVDAGKFQLTVGLRRFIGIWGGVRNRDGKDLKANTRLL